MHYIVLGDHTLINSMTGFEAIKSHLLYKLLLIVILLLLFSCTPVQFAQIDSSSNQLSTTEEAIKTLKPALVVSDAHCIICHSNISGNFVTDMGASKREDGKIHLYGLDSDAGYTDYLYGDYNTYGSRNFISTINIKGNIMIPKAELTEASQNFAKTLIQEYKSLQLKDATQMANAVGDLNQVPAGTFLKTNAPDAPVSLKDYLNTFINFRTDEFFETMGVIREHNFFSMLNSTNNSVEITEVKTLIIDAPTADEIKAKLSENSMRYLPDSKGAALKNFIVHGDFYANNDLPLECDGDVVVDGIVYLNNIKLKSKSGCRIYSTKSIFVTSDTEIGVDYSLSDANATLQLSSARGIIMGMGYCSNGNSLSDGRRHLESEILDDYARVKKDEAPLIKDSGDCGNRSVASRKVSFERILINAPRIDSRFTGDFKGVIIAKFSLWSLGQFKFEYDSIFDKTKILPLLTRPVFAVEKYSQ